MSSNVQLEGPYYAPQYPQLGPIYLGSDGYAYTYQGDDTLAGFFSSLGKFFKKHGGDIFVAVGGVWTAIQQQKQQQSYIDPTTAQALQQQAVDDAAARVDTAPEGFHLNTTTILIIAVIGVLVLRR